MITTFSNSAGNLNGENNAAFVVNKPAGAGYALSAVTGAFTAGLAANSSVFAMRFSPSTAKKAYIQRIRLEYTTIVAYTTPITAGRRLALFRGAGAAATGGTAMSGVGSQWQKSTGYTDSYFTALNSGDVRVATTGALTVTSITFDTDPIRLFTLSHVGAAGAYAERLWELHETENEPLVLQPGQLFAIRNPVAMDAAGTWQLAVNVDWYERD